MFVLSSMSRLRDFSCHGSPVEILFNRGIINQGHLSIISVYWTGEIFPNTIQIFNPTQLCTNLGTNVDEIDENFDPIGLHSIKTDNPIYR